MPSEASGSGFIGAPRFYHRAGLWVLAAALSLAACKRDVGVEPVDEPDPVVLPVLSVDTPARGSFHATSVTLAGAVEAGTGAPRSLELNGEPISLASDGSFGHTVTPPPGLLILGTRVEDDAGERAVDGRAVQVGPTHAPGATIADAVALQLGPELLDDDAPDLDDIAALTEVVIEDPAFGQSFVGTTFEDTFTITITGLWLDEADVEVVPNDGVMWFDTYLHDLYATFSTSIIGIGVTGSVTSTRAVLQMDVAIDTDASGVTAEVTWVQASLEGFDWEADWVPSWAEDLLAADVRDLVETNLEDQARDLVPDVLGETLSSFAVDTTFGEGDALHLRLEMSSAEVAQQGLILRMDASVEADRPGRSLPAGAGSLRTPGAAPTLPMDTDQPLVMLADDDFVNQVLFGFWHAGALGGWELNALELVAMTGEQLPPPLGPVDHATMDVDLPPVLSPATSGLDLDLSIGELHLGLVRDDGVEVAASLNVRSGADLVFLPSGMSLHLDDRPAQMTIHAGMLAWPEALDPGDLASLFRLSTPSLLGRSSSLLPAFPAPELPVGDLLDAAALDGVAWELDQPRVEMLSSGWIVIEGRMAPTSR